MNVYDFTVKAQDGSQVSLSDYRGFGLSPMGLAMNAVAKKMDRDFKQNSNIKWNFTKFLIGRDGSILAQFEPTVPMKTVMEAVKAAL